jgi:Leucine-rich repeat (LRR) protein
MFNEMKVTNIIFLFICIALSNISFAQTNVVPDDVELAALKDLWDNTGGQAWTNKTGWPTAGNWPATATAAQMDAWNGINIANGDITEVILTNNHLVGTIPTSIGNLTKLMTLRFDVNTLSGTVPSSINANLSSLQTLVLSSTSLTTMPDLGALTNLQTLSLANNPFTAGPVPQWLANLTSLRSLNLTSAHLTGTIPDLWGSMPLLTNVSMQSNSLTGALPSSITQLTHLLTLDLSMNSLSGSLPFTIDHMSALQQLVLYSNKLTGAIPSSITSLHNLQNLQIDNNLFTSIPNDWSALVSLQTLFLSHCLIEGNLPTFSLSSATLTRIDLQFNKFTGNIPDSYQYIPSLQRLYLNDNQLSGEINPLIGNAVTLNILTLQNNLLTGAIPASLGSLTRLTSLYLYGNQLVGPIPSTFSNLLVMQYLDLHGNQLSGPVPSIFNGMTGLNSLYLNNNRFSGALPTLRGQTIDVSNNMLTGDFPAINTITSIPITTVIGSNNLFTGITPTVSTWNSLLKLDLRTNELLSLPTNLLSHPNKANLILMVSSNRLDFSQLEPYATGFKTGTVLATQKTIHDVITKQLTANNQLVLTARPSTSNVSLVWEKQSSTGWTTLTNDEDVVANTYTRNSATTADEGVYHWKATYNTSNTYLANAVISSEPITVKTGTHFTLDNFAFQYKYDGRNRMIQKKVPGADWVYMVYDNRDRLVMTQDGNQRQLNQWTFTRYDTLNRPIMSGLYTHTALVDQPGMSLLIGTKKFCEAFDGTNTFIGYSNKVMPSSSFPGTFEPLTVTYYDNYNFINSDGYMAPKPSELTGQATPITLTNGLVTGSWTRILGKDRQWLRTVSYYDDKYRGIQTISDNHVRGQDITTNVYDFAGKVTATKTRTTSHRVQWINSAASVWMKEDRVQCLTGTGSPAFYSNQQIAGDGWVEFTCSSDSGVPTKRTFGLSSSTTAAAVGFGVLHSRTVTPATSQIQATENGTTKGSLINVDGGDVIRIERVGTVVYYRKNGVVFYTSIVASSGILYPHGTLNLNTSELYNPRVSIDGTTRSTERHFEYDHAGRLTKTWHGADQNSLVVLSKQEYNEIGQLVDKKLHSVDNTHYQQSLDYRYNIRGWLTSINGSDLNLADSRNNDDPTEKRDLFGMDLMYNIADANIGNGTLFNGNISAIKWSDHNGINGVKQRAYKFSYDEMSRLNSATSKFYTLAAWSPSGAFAESSIEYDLNGNISKLSRTNKDGQTMDQLTYDYGATDPNIKSNTLLKVTDAITTTEGFSDAQTGDNDYGYDANGNMISDKNKNITAITYNFLNLPDKVTKSTGEYINYFYDATGRKLTQDVYNASNVLTKKSNYKGEWFYENDTLRFISHEEGRLVPNGNWMDSPQLMPDSAMSTASNFVAYAAASAPTSVTISGKSYIKTVATGTGTPGFFSGYVYVVPGRKYLLRVKGYATSTGTTALYVQGDGTAPGDIAWGAALPYGASTEDWVEMTFTVPSNMNRVRLGVAWKTGAVSGSTFYVNTMGLFEYHSGHGTGVYSQTGSYDYQYHLKDHLGNVRMTFSTENEIESAVATFETSNTSIDKAHFLRYENARRVSSYLFDHTNEAAGDAHTSLKAANDFSTNTSYMQSRGTVAMSLVSGRLKAAGASLGDIVYIQLATTAGQAYKVTCDVDLNSGGTISAYAQDQSYTPFITISQQNVTANMTSTYTFTAFSSTTYIIFENTQSTPRDFYLDNLRIQAISGDGLYSQRLSGSANEKIGLAKSLSVMPGDVINAEVYAKYVDPNSNNWTAAMTQIMSYITGTAMAPSTAIVDGFGYPYAEIVPLGVTPIDHTGNAEGSVPKAYLNYIFINRDLDPNSIDVTYVPITTAAIEDGSDRPHERLSFSRTVTQAGYVYVYLSNDDNQAKEVYFDDFKVDHVTDRVEQSQDYYPFGLTFNSYQRENSLINRWKFQSQEHVDDLGLNWDSFKWRNHQPEIGRFFGIDKLADKYYYNSPYAFSENHVTSHVELEGLERKSIHEQAFDNEANKLRGVWDRVVYNVKQAIDKITPDKKLTSTRIEIRNSEPKQVEESQVDGSAKTSTSTGELDGNLNALYNKTAVVQGNENGDLVTTQTGSEQKVNGPTNQNSELKIDTLWGQEHAHHTEDTTIFTQEYRTVGGSTGEKATRGGPGVPWAKPFSMDKKNVKKQN